jgi:hypothetical protein
VASLALFVALGGGALAATGLVGSNGKIRGCVGGTGQLKVLKPGKHCRRGQTAIAWSQRGPSGDRGPKGAAGAKGDPGPAATNAAHAANADSAANADTLDNRDSSAFVLSGAEPWRDASLNTGTRGTAVEIQHYCFWTAYGSPWSSPGYFRDGFGVVHLRGLAKAHNGGETDCTSGSTQDNTMFSLPAGYRPQFDSAIATVSENSPGRINVRSGGTVEIENNFPTFGHALYWVSIDGLTFRCAPSGQNGCP